MTDLEKFLQVRGVRLKERRRQLAVQHYKIPGLRLERWMLKAMIGFAFEQPLTGPPWQPPVEWVEIAFGRRSFTNFCGLYISAPTSSKLELARNNISIKTLTKDGPSIGGVEFDLNGWAMTLSMVPLSCREAEYRPRFVRDRDRLETQQVICFDWNSP